MRNRTRSTTFTTTATAAVVAILAAACSPGTGQNQGDPGAGNGTGTGQAAQPPAPPANQEAPAAAQTEPTGAGQSCEAVTGTVNFRWWGGDARATRQNEALEVFRDLYPNITVNAMPSSWDGFWDQLQVEAVAGNTPDVFTATENWLPTLSANGVLANLSQIDTIDLSGYTPEMLGAGLRPNGDIVAVPAGGNAYGLMVNLDILAEAGIEPPDDSAWSWDDFRQLAQQISDAGLTNANGLPVFGTTTFPADGAARIWATQTDGGVFNADGELSWTEQSMADWFTTNVELIESGAAPSAATEAEAAAAAAMAPEQGLFPQGRVAFSAHWNVLMPPLAEMSGANVTMFRFPGDFTPGNNIGTWLNPSMFFTQSANAQDPEAAGCLMNFLVNSIDHAQIMGVDRGVPFKPSLAAAVEADLTGNQKTVAEFQARIAQHPGASSPAPELSEDWDAIMQQEMQSAIFGATTPEQAASSLRTRILHAIIQ